jgi:hypothetical protein
MWERRVWKKVAREVGLRQDSRARDLRATYATLLIYEGRNVVEVADQLGNSPEVCLKAYAGILAEFRIEDRKPSEQAILDARAELLVKNQSKSGQDSPQNPRADARTRTGDPFITSEVLYQLSYVGV